jgi:LPS export ABC transporter protein LptC
MMRPPTRRGIFTLAVLAVLSWLVAREPREAAVDPIGRPDVRLNYALYDFRGRLLDETGAVNFRIEAPELRNDAETGIGTVESPRIRIHENDDRWYIQAESAIISPDREQVILAGEVYLSRADDITGQLLEISSSDIVLEVTPRTARTEAPVRMRQQGDRVDAVGMRLDMINETFQLLSDVRAHYEIP